MPAGEPARHWAGRAGRPMRSSARPAVRRNRSPVMPGPWPRTCSATRRSGTTRPWARWCTSARNSSGGSMTYAPSSAIAPIVSDARAGAENLQRDAQERYHQAVGSLVHEREELERRVDDLRAFERDCRSRLKAYMEGQLRDLEADAADSEPFPHPDRATGGHVIGRL